MDRLASIMDARYKKIGVLPSRVRHFLGSKSFLCSVCLLETVCWSTKQIVSNAYIKLRKKCSRQNMLLEGTEKCVSKSKQGKALPYKMCNSLKHQVRMGLYVHVLKYCVRVTHFPSAFHYHLSVPYCDSDTLLELRKYKVQEYCYCRGSHHT